MRSPSCVVADERHPAVRAHSARGRLAHVVEERAEPDRLPARELVRQRLRQHRAQHGRKLPEHLLQPFLELDLVRQHLDRVAVHVLVVIAALLHVVEVVELREHRSQQPQPVGQRHAGEGAARHDQAPQLAEQPLGRGFRHPRGRRARERLGLGVGRELELGCQARQPERPQRVRLVGVRREDSQHTRVQIRPAALRIDHRAARHGPRHGVHAEVAAGQVRLDRLPLQGGHVVAAAGVAVERPPGTEPLGQRKHGAAEHARHGTRRGLGIAGHRHVHVGHRPAEQLVANGPAHNPGGRVPEGGDQRVTHRACSRSTRAESPQVTS